MPTKFKLNNREYTIHISWGAAVTTYPDKFGVSLLNLFEEQNLQTLLTEMMLNDQLAFEMLEFYVEGYLDTPSLIKALDEDPSGFQRFKDAWWDELMLFFGHPRSEMIRMILKEAPKMLNKGVQESLKGSLDSGSLSSQESQE